MRIYYGIVGALLTGIIFFAIGRATVSSPELPEPQPAPPNAVVLPPVAEVDPVPSDPVDPSPQRPAPAPRQIPFFETILEGSGTGDFAIEEVLYRDHPMGPSHLEREIEITYRNDATLTRVFTIQGTNREHKILLPPNSKLEDKKARGRMSLGKKDGKNPPFAASGCGYAAKPLPELEEE